MTSRYREWHWRRLLLVLPTLASLMQSRAYSDEVSLAQLPGASRDEQVRRRECVGQLIGPSGSVGNYGLTLGADWGVISPVNDRSGLEGCFFSSQHHCR
jgi:hypothetical protein